MFRVIKENNTIGNIPDIKRAQYLAKKYNGKVIKIDKNVNTWK